MTLTQRLVLALAAPVTRRTDGMVVALTRAMQTHSPEEWRLWNIFRGASDIWERFEREKMRYDNRNIKRCIWRDDEPQYMREVPGIGSFWAGLS